MFITKKTEPYLTSKTERKGHKEGEIMGVVSGMRTRTGVYAVIAALFVALAAMALPAGSAHAADDQSQLSVATPQLTTPEPLYTMAKSATIKPGTYYIQSQLTGEYMLDVTGASKKSGANVDIYTANLTKAQQWRVIKNSNGTYSIKSVVSGKFLDISGSVMANGRNVQQYKSNKTAAQRWTFTKSGTGYVIRSAVKSSFVLDVRNGKAANGTNVQIQTKNGSTAQKWWLVPVKASQVSQRLVSDGVYELRLSAAPAYTIDSASDNLVNGANVELHKRDSSMSQRWYLKWESDGYYSIRNVSTGKVFDIAGDSPAVGANIQSWTANGTDAQRWVISANKDGSYTFTNKATGLAIDAKGARAANGTNVQMNIDTHGASQRFVIKSVKSILPSGTYMVYSMIAPLRAAVDIPSASKSAGAQAQLYSANGSIAERFYFRKVSGSIYTIQSVSSGKYLTDSSGAVVQKKRSGKKSQQWAVSVNGNGLSFTNVATGDSIEAEDGRSTDGTKLITDTAASKKAQRFHLVNTRLIPDGYYEIKSAASSKWLDVKGGSLLNNANVQVYARNKTAAQTWDVTYVSGGYYRIVNDGSGKALDVTGASKDANANVQQYTYNKTKAQLWRPELRADGAIVFVNKGSSMALEAAGKKNGSNVRQNGKIGKAAQGWYLYDSTSRTLSGNTELDGYIRNVVNKQNGDLKKCFNWLKSNVNRVDAVNTTVPTTGVMTKQTTIDQALYVFRNKKADSYYFASAFKWLAIGCGYAAEARAGQVSSTTGSPVNHGWTEVTSNGQPFVCDADLAKSMGESYNWCMVSYDAAAVQYYK